MGRERGGAGEKSLGERERKRVFAEKVRDFASSVILLFSCGNPKCTRLIIHCAAP